MNVQDLARMAEQYVMHTGPLYPLAPKSGQGAALYDAAGKTCLDFSGGETILGQGNNAWAEAVLDQSLTLGASPGYHGPVLELARHLCLRSGMSRVCFTDSGSAANETMIQLARRYSHQRYGPGRSTILTLEGGDHGRSLATLAASGADLPALAPLDAGFLAVPADIAAMRQAQGPVCAVMLELISIQKGIVALGKQFIHDLAVLCAERDWLLLIDEVQTGIGRTGALFAFQQYGILPDAVSFGKGLANGLPMGGVLANSRCGSVLEADGPAALPGANPICAAGALAVLGAMDDTMLNEVVKKGDYLKSGIETLQLPCLGDIRSSGLMLAVETLPAERSQKFADRLAEAGVLCLPRGGALCLLPPLLVTRGEIDAALSIMKKTLEMEPGTETDPPHETEPGTETDSPLPSEDITIHC